LVYKIDRLTRSTKDLIELIELFNLHDCSFNSLSESIDTKTSTGRMFIKIIGIFAEFERENIVERVKLGLERKVREGYTIACKNLSYGYKRDRGEKIQTVDTKESKVVKKVYDYFLKGLSYSEIARILNSQNIKTKNNKIWSYKTVKLVLENPNYIGNVRYGINTNRYFEVVGKHSPIISREKFKKVKTILKNYKNNTINSIFGNKIICNCSSFLSVKKYTYNSKRKSNNSIYIRYVCNNNKCVFKSISEKKIDLELSKYISNWENLSYSEKTKYIRNNVDKILLDNGVIKKIINYS